MGASPSQRFGRPATTRRPTQVQPAGDQYDSVVYPPGVLERLEGGVRHLGGVVARQGDVVRGRLARERDRHPVRCRRPRGWVLLVRCPSAGTPGEPRCVGARLGRATIGRGRPGIHRGHRRGRRQRRGAQDRRRPASRGSSRSVRMAVVRLVTLRPSRRYAAMLDRSIRPTSSTGARRSATLPSVDTAAGPAAFAWSFMGALGHRTSLPSGRGDLPVGPDAAATLRAICRVASTSG